jgi:hypothetical protein
MQLLLEKGETPEHVCTMWKGVWSNEEPSEHYFKNRRESAALNISVNTGRINDLKQ